MNMNNNTQPSAMNMSNNKQANASAENDERVLNLIEKGKDPVRELNLAEAIAEQVAATTEAGDGAIPIPGKKHKISGDEDSSKWNKRLMEECHITPIAAPELVVENGQMADAPENGGLRRSTRPRKPNTRLKGYELYDPKMGYYLNE